MFFYNLIPILYMRKFKHYTKEKHCISATANENNSISSYSTEMQCRSLCLQATFEKPTLIKLRFCTLSVRM